MRRRVASGVLIWRQRVVLVLFPRVLCLACGPGSCLLGVLDCMGPVELCLSQSPLDRQRSWSPHFPTTLPFCLVSPFVRCSERKPLSENLLKNFNYLYSFSYLIVGSASYYSLLYLVFGGLGLNILFHILWYQYPCSRGVGSFLLLCRCLRV